MTAIPERIQKVLAQAGLASRRRIEEWITAGRISVNGKRAVLGDKITITDKVRLDGELIYTTKSISKKTRILLYNKPAGEVCSHSDEKGRKTVFEMLPQIKSSRWISIGRLDINTTGLLLFTNNGELANRLMHPSSEFEREYAVRVFGQVGKEILQKLKNGVMLEDGLARFTHIDDGGGKGSNHWYHVVIKEGRNREVRRIWESQGISVSRLIRVRFGPIYLPRNLGPGKYQELSPLEVGRFLEAIQR